MACGFGNIQIEPACARDILEVLFVSFFYIVVASPSTDICRAKYRFDA
jgi:hypothetical protein